MTVSMSPTLFALAHKIHYHGRDGNDQAAYLHPIEMMAIEVNRGQKSRNFSGQSNDAARQSTKLGDGHENEDLLFDYQ
jgi:hypothetical protein